VAEEAEWKWGQRRDRVGQVIDKRRHTVDKRLGVPTFTPGKTCNSYLDPTRKGGRPTTKRGGSGASVWQAQEADRRGRIRGWNPDPGIGANSYPIHRLLRIVDCPIGPVNRVG
jgi:hypothetical protein